MATDETALHTDIASHTCAQTGLTDEQRKLVKQWFADHPDSGYKRALAFAGIHTDKQTAKQLVEADDELSEARLRALKLDLGSLFQRIGEMSSDKEHRDSLRATTFALAVVHGLHEKTALEVTGADGAPLEVAAGYSPPSLADMVKLAGELGVLSTLGYERQDVIDGDAEEVVLELPEHR